jgi:tetratricopeptide (TPR) repeat protein
MQVRLNRFAVVAMTLTVFAAGCGKYSISNIRSAKAFQDGTQLYVKSDYKGAVPLFEKAVTLNPELGFGYFFLGNAYDNLYRPAKGKDDPANVANLEKAAANYRLAIDKMTKASTPKEQEVRRDAFEYLIAVYGPDKLSDFDKAEPVAKELIAADPGDPATYRILAKLYEDQGRFDEAEAQLKKSIDVKPTEAQGYQMLAGYYTRRGDFQKTMEAWQRRADVEPKNPESWHMIGAYIQAQVFGDKKMPRATALKYTLQGIAAEDKALDLSPEYYEALIYKNILLRQQALYETNPATQKDLITQADALMKKADAVKKKTEGAPTPTPPAKGK